MKRYEAIKLIERADTEIPAMVLGISVESAIELLKKDVLPAERMCRAEMDGGNYWDYFLHFVARKEAFKNHPLYSKIQESLDKEELHESVRGYADIEQQEEFMKQLCGGYWAIDICPEEIIPDYRGHGEKAIFSLEDLAKEGVNVRPIKEYGLKRLGQTLKDMNGVIIGINEWIFENPIKADTEIPWKEPNEDYTDPFVAMARQTALNKRNSGKIGADEIIVGLSKGLDIKYVSYILPLGLREESKLMEAINKLE